VADIMHVPTASATERFRERYAEARAALATVSALDREMAQCLDEMRREGATAPRIVAAQLALQSIREVLAVTSRVVPQTAESDVLQDVARVA